MAQEQEAEAKRSLVARVSGSRIAQAIGIFGVAFTLFQGLEPFLKFSRLMAYLVNHWRELTRGLWIWLASFISLDVPTWMLDFLTVATFLVLYTVRSMRNTIDKDKVTTITVFLDRLIQKVALKGKIPDRSILGLLLVSYRVMMMGVLMVGAIVLGIGTFLVVPLTIFLSAYGHTSEVWELTIGGSIAWMVFLNPMYRKGPRIERLYAFAIVSAQAILVLVGLLCLNYVALYSYTIEAFIEKATQ